MAGKRMSLDKMLLRSVHGGRRGGASHDATFKTPFWSPEESGLLNTYAKPASLLGNDR